MRQVAHLVGAEMIHNLYDRYWPQINSIRFRHTITNYKDGIVESYAPVSEWNYLQKWVSEKFIALDPILIREIENILHPTYELTNEICSIIDHTDLEHISNVELAQLMINIMDFPLGEIYKLNVVQIEYGLNFALNTLLKEYEPDANERNNLLSKLISPDTLTVAQEEEVAFDALIHTAREWNSEDLTDDVIIERLLQAHYDAYAPKHCAYGENPPTIDEYLTKFRTQFNDKVLVSYEAAKEEVESQYKQSRDILESLNDERLTKLCILMSQIGVFRDRNKAKVGETVPRRLKLMDEIARRTQVDRQELNYYLVAELVELLGDNKKLDDTTIEERKNGVSLVRNDHLAKEYIKMNVTTLDKGQKLIPGICASQGSVSGNAKIITSKDDITKMQPGDIMVAIGTDFDLLEIMHLSAGIITEEGGLLSHASVVSRELGKPCLIGVANATKYLKDGDQITLDATKGAILIH